MSPSRATSTLPRDLSGLPVTVMGLGLFGGGAATARFLAARGARVTVTDLRAADELAPALAELAGIEARFVLGEHRTEDFTGARVVVANPAVPPRSPFLEAARSAGVLVTSETALFLEHTAARLALVTGTQGKSSTCHFLAQLLSAAPFRVHLGGNIGTSLLDDLGGMTAEDVAVVEISSYQLETLPPPGTGIAPRVPVVAVTNVLSDHLERHGTRAAYAAAKARILELVSPDGSAVVPRHLAPRVPRRARAVVHGNGADARLRVADGEFRLGSEPLGRVADLRLAGAFQAENALVALGLARLLDVDASVLAGQVAHLTGLPHRVEDVGVRGGVRVIDNGVSTTPDSTVAVLAGLRPPCTLVCGGRAKRGLPFDELVAAARRAEVQVVAFGEAGETLAAAFRAGGVAARAVRTLDEAVPLALANAPAGGRVLFSPACSSFDAYANFRARAHAFRALLPPRDPD